MDFLKKHRRLTLLLVSAALIWVPGYLNNAFAVPPGCTADEDVMISLSDLAEWIATGKALEDAGGDFKRGYNNGARDSCGYKKMAILSVQTAAAYAAGHPYGAFLWDQGTELRTDRTDGLLLTKRQVATQEMMDLIVDRAGLNKQTVVVLTGDNLQQIGVAYFNLRYWGFPKSRLRVANGVLADYDGLTTTSFPVNTGDEDFSVCDQDKRREAIDEVRASLAEMMSVAEDEHSNTIVLDVRSSAEFLGTRNRTDVAFEGHIKTAVWSEWENHVTHGVANAGQIKDIQSLEALFAAQTDEDGDPAPITSADTVYIYCQTATRTGVTFLALDAVLGWKVKMYDGSWTEWGNLAANDSTPGDNTLPAGSDWALDNDTYTDLLNDATECTSDNSLNCGRTACVDDDDNIIDSNDNVVAIPNQTNENDKQICTTGVPLRDCNGNPN